MSEEKAPAKKPWTAKRIIYTALTWIIVLVLVEFGVRLAYPEAGQPVYSGYPKGLVIPDGDLGHKYKPDFAGNFPQPMYSEIPIQTNADGFRNAPWKAAPEPGVTRVLVMGDSITFGSPLKISDRFTEQAALLLNDKGYKVEFCNLGVNGYNLDQYQKQLEIWGPKLKPSIVLIGYCLNDAEPLNPDDARLMALHDQIKQGSTWAKVRQAAWKSRLDLGQSYIVNIVRRTMKIWLWSNPKSADKMIAEYNQKTKNDLKALYSTGNGVARVRESMSAMADYAQKELGARLAVVIFVYHHQLKDKDPDNSEKVAGVLKELNVPFVDLYSVFLPHLGQENLYAHQDDCHPGPPGHALAGKATAGLVESFCDFDKPDNQHENVM